MNDVVFYPVYMHLNTSDQAPTKLLTNDRWLSFIKEKSVVTPKNAKHIAPFVVALPTGWPRLLIDVRDVAIREFSWKAEAHQYKYSAKSRCSSTLDGFHFSYSRIAIDGMTFQVSCLTRKP
jgi:hypothetical protein